jgi:hypothetical protein
MLTFKNRRPVCQQLTYAWRSRFCFCSVRAERALYLNQIANLSSEAPDSMASRNQRGRGPMPDH